MKQIERFHTDAKKGDLVRVVFKEDLREMCGFLYGSVESRKLQHPNRVYYDVYLCCEQDQTQSRQHPLREDYLGFSYSLRRNPKIVGYEILRRRK